MEKMRLPLGKFLTLIGPAQIIEIKTEDEKEYIGGVLYSGTRAKIRGNTELLEREVKLIQPVAVPEHEKLIQRVWIY